MFMLQVVMIQACQGNAAVALNLKGKEDPAVPGQLSDPLRDQHITLTMEDIQYYYYLL